LSRFQHRLKTFGGWLPVRLADGGIEWTSPRGNRYRVDHTGTHYLGTTRDRSTRDRSTRDRSAGDRGSRYTGRHGVDGIGGTGDAA